MKRNSSICGSAVAKGPRWAAGIVLAAAVSSSAAWPGWRGPDRNGVAKPGAEPRTLPAENAKPVWTSEPILSERDGGYGSTAVADGRVYVYSCWRTKHPVDYRVIREENLADLGNVRPKGLSDESHAAIEAARFSPERKAVPGDDLDRWMSRWITANLSPEQRKAPGVSQYATDRLRRGDRALPDDALKIVESVIDRKFESVAALDAWAATSGIEPGVWMRQIKSKVPDYERTEEDVLFCLDARDGSTLWKFTKPSQSTRWSSSTTPCVADGGVFFVGAQGIAYALDAATGKERWTTSLAGVGEAGNGHNSSFAFADGKLFVMAGRLVALDATSGRIIWECGEATGFSSSPVIWRHEGKTYVIGGEGRHRLAIDAESGAVLWKVPAGGPATPAIHGDLMAVAQGEGLVAYRLSLKGAEKVAETEKGGSKGGSPVAFGSRVYSGSFEAACLDAETGKLLWATQRGLDHYSSGVLANGILWCPGRGGLLALDPDTGAEIGRLKVDYLRCSSPAVAGGKMFLRTRKAVACYDLAAGAD